jgi:DNA-binding GntR family transcriptional regulator
MPPPVTVEDARFNLVKEQLAAQLKQAVMDGRLLPGQRVIEATWAREFGVAQASVREAINLLVSEGFLVKDAGRSGRVVDYKEQDVKRIFEVRSALEGLAAQIACETEADLSGMESAFERMSASIDRGDTRSVLESDLEFHLALAEASGNTLLIEMLRRLLSPLFAFILIRVLKSGQRPEPWKSDLPRHLAIIQMIHEGNPSVAAQYVRHSISRFERSAYAVWENVPGAVDAHKTGKSDRKARQGI